MLDGGESSKCHQSVTNSRCKTYTNSRDAILFIKYIAATKVATGLLDGNGVSFDLLGVVHVRCDPSPRFYALYFRRKAPAWTRARGSHNHLILSTLPLIISFANRARDPSSCCGHWPSPLSRHARVHSHSTHPVPDVHHQQRPAMMSCVRRVRTIMCRSIVLRYAGQLLSYMIIFAVLVLKAAYSDYYDLIFFGNLL